MRSRLPAGYSLVEVVISILLISVITTAVFSVALSSKANSGQNGRNDRQQLAGAAQREISGLLRNFVTGCCDPKTGYCEMRAGVVGSCYPISGPNGGSSWSLDGYVLNGTAISETPKYDYALAVGTHNLATKSNILPAWFTGAPYNATVSYVVAPGPSYANPAAFPIATDSFLPQVTVTVSWTEPGS